LTVARRLARLRSLDPLQWRVLLAALALVPTVQLALRVLGFRPTAGRLAAWSDRPVTPASVAEARAVAEPVAIVAGRRLVGARCLGRSLVLWFLLRRRGVDAELLIGADATAGVLSAHAWVEVEGQPVNDVPDVRDRYGSFGVPLPRLSPPPR
jgi:hypothetical protein